MTIGGSSGTGGDVGNAGRMSSQVERDTSPLVFVNKAALAIVADSMEISFTRFGGNTWKYEADSGHALLDAPLISTRRQASTPTEDQSWKEVYEDLVQNELPAEVATRLAKEQTKSAEEKNESYSALNEALTECAKAISTIKESAKPDSPDSKNGIDSLNNSMMAPIADTNLQNKGTNFLRGANQFLSDVGPNYQYYDQLSNHLQQLQRET